jgi:hypothetical protein
MQSAVESRAGGAGDPGLIDTLSDCISAIFRVVKIFLLRPTPLESHSCNFLLDLNSTQGSARDGPFLVRARFSAGFALSQRLKPSRLTRASAHLSFR